MTVSIGTRLGPYVVESALGAGGMGKVYKARDSRLDRIVAIKVLSSELAGDPAFRERFDREARAISALDHPHISTLYDVGRQDGVDFLVMEHLDDENLASRLTKGPLRIDQALRTAVEIADALDRAHRPGIVHRDLKPSNIMFTKSGAKLLDFGLAKTGPVGAGTAGAVTALATTPPSITGQGTILGTFQYMAPEQLQEAIRSGRRTAGSSPLPPRRVASFASSHRRRPAAQYARYRGPSSQLMGSGSS